MIAVRATPMIGDSVIHGRDDKVKLRVEVVR